MAISESKKKALKERFQKNNIFEKDIDESFVRSSGAGGQKVNKSASCVRLIHKPSGIEVKCQMTRSQTDNRFLARRILCEKYEGYILQIKTEAARAAHKKKKQKKRRSRRSKQKMLEGKRKQSEKKNKRKTVKRHEHD